MALVRTALRRLRRALTTWPAASGWLFALMVGAPTLALSWAVGFTGGLYRLQAGDFAGLPTRMAAVFFVPALGEEAVFRGLLIPDRSETARPWASIATATALFTLWHVVQTLYAPQAAPVFLRPDFLATTAIEGLGCALIRWRTGSLWPAVALHWLEVVVWQTWLGGLGATPRA
jgi:predicted Abi (CAAX) family protease